MTTDEQYCYQALAELRKSYERAAKPYIDRLVAIKSMEPPQPFLLTLGAKVGEFEIRSEQVASALPPCSSDQPDTHIGGSR